MAIMKRPSFPVPLYGNGLYQPPSRTKSRTGDWYETHVQTGDTWVTLAKLDGWANAWELIQANFRTLNAEEVNWYLKHYVGCTAETPDKENFRFSSSDYPGIIYTQNIISRKGTLPGIALQKFVMSVLGSSAIRKVSFSMLGGYTIEPSHFSIVRNHVDRGWIQIIHAPTMTDADGKYQFEKNRLRLKHNRQDAVNAALVVHECTHAALDNNGRNFNKAYSEALGYVAQCLYYHHRTGNYLSDGGAEKDIFDTANDIVIEIVDRQFKTGRVGPHSAPKALATKLLNAINSSSLYKGAKGRTVKYDGIDDPRYLFVDP